MVGQRFFGTNKTFEKVKANKKGTDLHELTRNWIRAGIFSKESTD
jgi:hypothetical protein